jgi:hypothetical protein
MVSTTGGPSNGFGEMTVMLRKVLGTVLLLGALAGCTAPVRVCETDDDCPGGGACAPDLKVCFSGSAEGGACEPACAPYQACTPSNVCVPRYTALTVTPGDGGMVGAGPVAVRAELVKGEGFAGNFPETLSFSVVRSDGGTGGTLAVVTRNEGVYTTQWTPAGEGEFRLTAAHPEAGGPSTTVGLTVDTTGPSFVVLVPPGNAGVPDGGFTYADPMAVAAWRRDQTVTVRVESDSADLDPSSLSVLVRGHAGGTNLEGLSLAQVSPCAGKAFCGTVDVPLWLPGLPAFRGNFAIEVTARDRVGNEVTRTNNIPVSRWKWSFNGAAGPIRASPAIGQSGTVYLGTSDSNGKVFALAPDGTKIWEVQLGSVQGSPAVGEFSAGSERVYVGVNNSSGAGVLYALGANGSISGRCPGAGIESGAISTAAAILNTKLDVEATPVETAVALGNGDALLALRPGATGSRQCSTVPLAGSAQQGASVIAKGTDVYFGAQDTDAKVQSYRFAGTGLAAKSGFTAPVIGTVVTGLGFSSGDRIVGAAGLPVTGSGGIFSFIETDGSGLQKNPGSFTGAPPVRNMSIGTGDVLFYGREVAGGGELIAIDLLATQSRASAPNAGSFVGAPVLGASNTFYTAATSGPSPGIGEVSAWSTGSLNMVWKLNDSVGRAEASPSLDCSRNLDGTAASVPHGVLYVPSIDGKLYAFVVDSRGLDTSAPWPKYQHDSRNTGNPATPITSCP